MKLRTIHPGVMILVVLAVAAVVLLAVGFAVWPLR